MYSTLTLCSGRGATLEGRGSCQRRKEALPLRDAPSGGLFCCHQRPPPDQSWRKTKTMWITKGRKLAGLVAATVITALVVAACGGGDDTAPPPTRAPVIVVPTATPAPTPSAADRRADGGSPGHGGPRGDPSAADRRADGGPARSGDGGTDADASVSRAGPHLHTRARLGWHHRSAQRLPVASRARPRELASGPQARRHAHLCLPEPQQRHGSDPQPLLHRVHGD